MLDFKTLEQAKEVLRQQEEKERLFFESWGYSGLPVIAAGLNYQAFLEKEMQENPNNIYKTPIARRCFMIGWLRAQK